MELKEIHSVSAEESREGATAVGGAGVNGGSTKVDRKPACPQSTQQPPTDLHLPLSHQQHSLSPAAPSGCEAA